jgi:signal transduction histidine kinase
MNGKNIRNRTLLNYFKRLSFIFILLFMPIAHLYGSTGADSLYNAIKNYSGLPKIEARLQLAFELRSSDFEKSSFQSRRAYKESLELDDIELQAQAMYYLGLAFNYKNMSDSAVVCFNRSSELYRKVKNYDKLSKVLCMLGTNYLGLTGDQHKAITHYNEALVYARKNSDHKSMAMIYSQLSNIFRMNGAYQQAIDFIYKSKEHYEAIDFEEGVAWVYYSIGRIYTTMSLYEEAQKKYYEGYKVYSSLPETTRNLKGVAICLDEMGLTSLELGNAEKAKEYNLQAQAIYDRIGEEFGKSNAKKYLARIEYTLGNNDAAIMYLEESRKIKKKQNDVLGLPGVYDLYGKILREQGKHDAAIDSLNVGLSYAEQNDQKNRIMSLNRQLAEIYAEMGKYDIAYTYWMNELQIMDQINESKATRALTQLEALYDLESKEAVIRELEQEKKINETNLKREIAVRNLLLIILTMTVVFAFFFLKLFSSNKQTNEALKRNQIKLQEMNATKDKFTSIIAHDLKSPFNSILGFSNLLIKYSENGDYEKVKEFSEHIREVSTHTYKLLENLLEWSRSQTGKINFNPKALDIRIPVKNATDLLYPNARKKDIQIEVNVPTIAVLVDEHMLHTILQNILSNAIKYSNKGSKIVVSGRELKDKLLLSIKDEGVGMDPETVDKLFRIDETVSTFGTEGERGTGLGLILCKEFIERHRGKISVKSEKDKGSEFTIELPL